METEAEHQGLIDIRRRSGEQPRTPNPGTPAAPLPSWSGDHPCGTMEEEHQPDCSPSPVLEVENVEHSFVDDALLLWRPRYLRRSVIATFIFVFAILVAAIETLVRISSDNDGIATSRPKLHYLWTFGPTAFLTLVAAFWSRVEYQSKLVAPWRRLMQQQAVDAKRTLLLDYISDPQPVAIVKAFRNRDWTVSITCTVSILIKVLIVISTGLITLSWTPVHFHSYPMILQDTFSNSSAQRLSKTKTTSFIFMEGQVSQNLSYPDGLSKDYAFQSATADLPDSAETRVTVDGLTNGLNCVPADIDVMGTDFLTKDNGTAWTSSLNVTITSPGCNITVLPIVTPEWFDLDDRVSANGFIARFDKVRCDYIEDDKGNRVLVMFGNMTLGVDYSRNMPIIDTHDAAFYDARHPLMATIHRSTQMLCIPTYIIRSVDIVRNGTHSPSVVPVPGSSERSLGSLHPWAIMEAQFNAVSSFKFTIIALSNKH